MAFHPYPQLIRRFCSTDRFGPPDGVTRPSPWPWIDRSASRLQRATKAPYSDSVSLRLRLIGLTLPHATTPWLIFQEARSQACHKGIALPLACRSMVSGSVSLPFRGSFHRSLAVLCAIGQPGIFSLTRWSGQIPTTFHGGSGTWERIPGRPDVFAYGAFTLCGSGIPPDSANARFCNSPRGRQPPPDTSRYPVWAKAAAMAPTRFGLLPFRSPLLRESHSLSFPRATKRFYFARFGSR